MITIRKIAILSSLLVGSMLTACSDDTPDTVAGLWGDQITEEPTPEPDGPEAPNLPTLNATATEVAKAIVAGINIGNTMECPEGEGKWTDAKVNKDYIAGLKAAGFNAVRIPCAWDSHLTDRTAYTIDPAWLDRVDEVIGWCYENDMYVLLNCHWDGGWLEDNIFDASKEAQIVAEQSAIWRQVAEKLAKYDSHLIFGACNEPGMNETTNDNDRWSKEPDAIDRLVKYEQAMIDAVRAAGGYNATRCIAVQGLGASISGTDTYFDKFPTDNIADRLMAEIHFYEPYQFALMEQDAGWGNTFWYWGKDNHVAGSAHNPTWGEEDYVQSQFAKINAKYVAKGIPVVLGEYSAMFRNIDEDQAAHERSVAYYGQVVTREAKAAGCIPFYWETGAVVNRNDGTIRRQDIIDGLVKGAADGKYPY